MITFADDIMICSENRQQVEENLERWRSEVERRGMQVAFFPGLKGQIKVKQFSFHYVLSVLVFTITQFSRNFMDNCSLKI